MGDYADTKRWRLRYPQKRHTGKRRYYQRNNQNPVNSGKEWTILETTFIVAHDRSSDRNLAQRLGRSIQAIQVKRAKLKKKTLVTVTS